MKHSYRRTPQFIYRTMRSFWGFPIALLLLILFLSLCGISGSSVGSYDGILNNEVGHSSVLDARPRAIRSDEWLVNTQMTIAQFNDDFPVINNSIGTGQDMTVVLDVPYKEWSVLFKPQNLIFFISPLNFAFAFKWWFLGGLLAFSIYTLFLRVMPKQKLAAILLAMTVFFAPMVQWWYQSITILPLAYGALILAVLYSLHGTLSNRQRLLFSALLTYLVTCFAFVMYPPFQIPVAVVAAFCYTSYFVIKLRQNPPMRKREFKIISLVLASSLLGLSFVILYLWGHSTSINTISHTVYPGQRDIAAGNYSIYHVLGNYLAPYNLSESRVRSYTELLGGTNQSEISNFLFPVVPLLALGYYVAFRKKIQQQPLATSIVLGSCLALTIFLLRLSLHFGDGLYALLGLNLVPHNRLLIGLGFACITLTIGLAAAIGQQKIHVKKWAGITILFALIGLYTYVTYVVIRHNPGYIRPIFIAACAITATVGFFMFLLYGRLKFSLLLLFGLSFVSTCLVNPIQSHLREVTDTTLAKTIQSADATDPTMKWISYDTVVLENYAAANGANTLSNTYTYPQLRLWQQLDPTHKSDSVYNRYAHVQFSFDDANQIPAFTLLAPDTFQVKISACSSFLQKQNVHFLYGDKPLHSQCLAPYKQLQNSPTTIYIYSVVRP